MALPVRRRRCACWAKRCIKKGTISGEFRPVVCGSSFKNKGVQPLLDAVIDYLPSPVDIEGIKVAPEEGQDETADRRVIPADENAPFAGGTARAREMAVEGLHGPFSPFGRKTVEKYAEAEEKTRRQKEKDEGTGSRCFHFLRLLAA